MTDRELIEKVGTLVDDALYELECASTGPEMPEWYWKARINLRNTSNLLEVAAAAIAKGEGANE
jgi:hypothetical protein